MKLTDLPVLALALSAATAGADGFVSQVPLGEGYLWSYRVFWQDQDSGFEDTYSELETIRGTDQINGLTTYRLGFPGQLDEDGDIVEFNNVAWGPDGLGSQRVVWRDRPGDPLSEAIAEDPMITIPREIDPGQTVTDTGYYEVFEDGRLIGYAEAEISITFVGYENVTVPAGTYDASHLRHSYRIVQRAADDGRIVSEETETQDTWLVPGIGPIKELHDDEFTSFEDDYYDKDYGVRELLAATIDGVISADPQSVDGVERAYVAYYGRPGDPDGTLYWTGRLTFESGNLDALIDQFAYSQEAEERFGELDYGELLDNLYQQMFNRDPDPAGRAFYLGQLESGASDLQRIMLDVLNGALNEDAAIIDNKLVVARYFTEQVRAAGKVYGLEDIAASRAVLDAVTPDPASIETAKALADAAIAAMATE